MKPPSIDTIAATIGQPVEGLLANDLNLGAKLLPPRQKIRSASRNLKIQSSAQLRAHDNL